MPDSPDDAQSTAIRVGANARLGDITVQGDVAGRDIVKIAEDLTYDVSDLSQNPYLGLASYTYAMRAFYGGREPLIAAAVERLTAAGDEPALVFITGASGSGKSSFAQAGLIPALEQAYAARRCRVRWSVARPGHHPVQALGRALHELGVADPPDGDWLRVLRAPEDLNLLLASRRQGEQVNVLLFDQFEELFTQADPSERDVVTALLSGLGTFSDLRTHVLATLRSDYLSRLFDTPALLERFKRDGIELRAMSSDELARAIRRPLQAQASMDGKEKRIDPALVERLVEDVGEDPSLLPLLQVTLRGLWDEPPHRLVLERYRSLTDALEQQADQVWQRDAQGRERPPAERDQLMSILLDLVEVSLDDDPRRDVRRTLPKYELLQGPPERGPLIEELVAARLLATSVEHGPTRDIEVVDIVHETLLRSWPRLSEQIVARRAGLQQRERFRNALQEWLQHDRSDDYLLAGVRLAEARQLAAADDLSTRGVDARSLLARSIDQQEQVHRRELAQAQALAEEQSHRADVERSARRRQAVFTVAILALAVVAGAVAVIALSLRAQTDAALLQATNEQALARSRALALQSVAQLDTNPDSSLVLATEAALTGATTDAEDALRQALLRSHVRAELDEPSGPTDAAFSPDGSLVVTGAQHGPVKLWNLVTGQQTELPVDTTAGSTVASSDQSQRVASATSAVAFGHDGQHVASASYDGTARVWTIQGGTVGPPLTLTAQSGSLVDVQLSPDDTRVLTSSTDQSAAVWNISAGGGSLALSLVGHTSTVNQAIFNPRGDLIATASQDGTAKLWDARTGVALATFPADEAVLRVAFSHDGTKLATASYDKRVRVYDLADPGSPVVLAGHTGAVVAVAFNPDDQEIVSASSDQTAIIWSLDWIAHTGTKLQVLSGHTGALTSAEFSPDGTRVLTSSADRTARIWDAGTGNQLASLRGHTGEVIKAAFSDTGSRILTVGDTTTRVWEPTADQELVALTGFRDAVTTVQFSRDGALVLAGGAAGTAQIWNTDDWSLRSKLTGHTDGIVSATFDAAADAALTASLDGTAILWEISDGRPVQRMDAQAGPLTAAELSPDGQTVVASYRDGSLRLWHAGADQAVTLLPPTASPVTAIAFDPGGASFATVAADGSVLLWDTSTHTQRPLDGHVDWITGLAMDPHSGHLATSSADATIRVWDPGANRLLTNLEGHTAMTTSAAFSPDGSRVVSSSVDGTARIWNLADPATSLVLSGHRLPVWTAVFSPSGRAVLTSGDDGTARLWDATTGAQITTLPGHTGPVRSAVFSPDERYIATAGRDGVIQIHLTHLADLVKLATAGLQPAPARLSTADLQQLQSRLRKGGLPADNYINISVQEPELADVAGASVSRSDGVTPSSADGCRAAVHWQTVLASHPKLGCATLAASTDTTYRVYERGMMIWWKSPSPSQVYVLSQSARGNRWQAFQDYSTDPQVASVPSQGCPEYQHSGRMPPVPEFDTLWCEPWDWKLPLGQLTQPDQSGGGNLIQQFQHGTVLSLANGPGLILYDDHTWDKFAGPS